MAAVITVAPRTPGVDILSPKELEEQCRQPVAIMSVLTMLGTLPVNILSMFSLFTKMEKMFNPNRLAAAARRAKLGNRVTPS
jgi:hypothetical protein